MRFEENKTYEMRLVSASNTTVKYTVTKRTKYFVILVNNEDNQQVKKKIYIHNDGVEFCKPLGDSRPVLRAKKVKEEVKEAKEEKKEDRPHYVVQHENETKKLGIFPSYEAANEWIESNAENYRGMLGVYNVQWYDRQEAQKPVVKEFELVGNKFKEKEEVKPGKAKIKKRVMHVKGKNINWSAPESLKPVMAKRFRKNKYTHVFYMGKEYSCRTAPFDIFQNSNVFIDFY